MTYRVEFDGAALVQLNGLPSAAFDALVERVVALVQEPWDAELMAPGDDPAYRQVIFGEGEYLKSTIAFWSPSKSSSLNRAPARCKRPENANCTSLLTRSR